MSTTTSKPVATDQLKELLSKIENGNAAYNFTQVATKQLATLAPTLAKEVIQLRELLIEFKEHLVLNKPHEIDRFWMIGQIEKVLNNNTNK